MDVKEICLDGSDEKKPAPFKSFSELMTYVYTVPLEKTEENRYNSSKKMVEQEKSLKLMIYQLENKIKE